MLAGPSTGWRTPEASDRLASAAPSGSPAYTSDRRPGQATLAMIAPVSGEEASPADRAHHRVQVRDLLHELQGRGALARHDIHVVKRVHHRGAGFAHDPLRGGLPRLVVRLAERDPAAVALDRRQLEAAGRAWHDDEGRDPADPGGPRERRRVVPGRVGRHPARRLGVGQGKDRVQRAARLECARLLEVLALEEQLRAREGDERAARQHRRPPDPALDPRVGLPDAPWGDLGRHRLRAAPGRPRPGRSRWCRSPRIRSRCSCRAPG